MAQNVIIRGVTYEDCPEVSIPLASGTGNASFVDTSDATLSSGGQMLNGYTAYGAEGKVTGSIETKTGSSLSASGDTVIVPAGYYATSVTKAVNSGSATMPASVTMGSAQFTVSEGTARMVKTASITPLVTEGYVSEGTSRSVTVTLSTSMATQAAQTITPGTTNQTIPGNQYLTGPQTIAGDSNLVAANIVAGKTIFNVAGTAQIPVISQDSVTKVLSIS